MSGPVSGMHFGRAWSGHAIEDECPCPKAPCGLVTGIFSADCPQHNPAYMKTMRQGHSAENCPAA
jgi:hypothetical protein